MFGFFRLNDWEIVLPLKSLVLAKYISFSKNSGCSKSAITTTLTAAKWLNAFFPGINKYNDSLNDEFLQRIATSAKRDLSKPKIRKAPLTGDLVKDIIKKCDFNSLKSLRDTLVPALCYSLLLRYNELSNITCNNIFEESSHYRFTIPFAKNDQLRSGRDLFLSKSSNSDSISNILGKYLIKANLVLGKNHFLMCQLRFDAVSNSNVVLNKPLSYSVCREIIKSSVTSLGLDSKLYSTHSGRAGGATDLAPHATQLELQTAGRWNDPRSFNNYVQIPLERRLELSRHLVAD